MNTELRMRVVPDLRFLAAGDGAPDRIQGKAIVYGAVSEDMGGWREVFAPALGGARPRPAHAATTTRPHGHRSPERQHARRHGRRLGHRGDRLPAGHELGARPAASRWSAATSTRCRSASWRSRTTSPGCPARRRRGRRLRPAHRAARDRLRGLGRGHPGIPANDGAGARERQRRAAPARLVGAAGRAARGQGALAGEPRRADPDPRPRRDRAQRRRPELGRGRRVAAGEDGGDETPSPASAARAQTIPQQSRTPGRPAVRRPSRPAPVRRRASDLVARAPGSGS